MSDINLLNDILTLKIESSEDGSKVLGYPKVRKLETTSEEKTLRNLKFSYSASKIEADSKELRVELFFDSPKHVSQSIEGRDNIRINIVRNDIITFGT